LSSAAQMTDAEVNRALEDEGTVRPLYNPSREWIRADFGAQPFRLCPDGEAEDVTTGEVRTTDGITPIKDFWSREWVEATPDEPRHPTGNRVKVLDGVDIVKHILKSYPFVARLSGDPKRDEAIKAAAKKKWIDHEHKNAQAVKANREEYLREFHSSPSNRGQVPNPPNAQESKAYEFLAEYNTGLIGRKAFVCRHDGWNTDDREKWDRHQQAFHPDDVSKAASAGDDEGTGTAGGKKGKSSRS
jgi:hypothetical protein